MCYPKVNFCKNHMHFCDCASVEIYKVDIDNPLSVCPGLSHSC